MVAFITSPIDTLLQGATRARAPGRTCTAVPTLPCKHNSRCDLRETKLAPNTRWGSRSRDPIGYRSNSLNYLVYSAFNVFFSNGIVLEYRTRMLCYIETDFVENGYPSSCDVYCSYACAMQIQYRDRDRPRIMTRWMYIKNPPDFDSGQVELSFPIDAKYCDPCFHHTSPRPQCKDILIDSISNWLLTSNEQNLA